MIFKNKNITPSLIKGKKLLIIFKICNIFFKIAKKLKYCNYFYMMILKLAEFLENFHNN